MFSSLRTIFVTVAATAAGIVNVATGRDAGERAELAPGDAAPLFALPGSDGVTYRLADLIGRQAVVIAWFPKAFTGACTAECRSLAASSDTLRQFNVRYFGASVDTPETNARFAQSLDLDFPILSDPEKTVARAYGVLSASGFPSRWTFYVDVDGRILFVDKQVNARSHGGDVADALASYHKLPRLKLGQAGAQR